MRDEFRNSIGAVEQAVVTMAMEMNERPIRHYWSFHEASMVHTRRIKEQPADDKRRSPQNAIFRALAAERRVDTHFSMRVFSFFHSPSARLSGNIEMLERGSADAVLFSFPSRDVPRCALWTSQRTPTAIGASPCEPWPR